MGNVLETGVPSRFWNVQDFFDAKYLGSLAFPSCPLGESRKVGRVDFYATAVMAGRRSIAAQYGPNLGDYMSVPEECLTIWAREALDNTSLDVMLLRIANTLRLNREMVDSQRAQLVYAVEDIADNSTKEVFTTPAAARTYVVKHDPAGVRLTVVTFSVREEAAHA